MQLRDANIADLPAIVEIYNSTVPGRMVTADTEEVTVEDKRNWFDSHTPDKRPIWIAEDNGELIGWVSFRDFYGRPAYGATAEISIYLHPKQRGKGYGKSILREAIGRSPELGIQTLLGFIFAHNTGSIHLFRQAGFEEWGHLDRIAIMDGKEYSLKIFGKRITS